MAPKSKFTTTYILGGILIILIATAFLVKGNINFLNPKTSNMFIDDFNAEEITKIEIINQSQTQTLERKENSWVVSSQNDVGAEQKAVLAILEETKRLTKDGVASKNPEKRSVYQVDKDGTQVKLFKGENEVANFYIGKTGPDFSSTYIRKENEDIVYLFLENIGSTFNRNDFRNLEILTFDKDKVKSLTFETQKTQFVVEKIEDKWELTAPLNVEVNQDKINFTLNDLANLKGKDIITDTEGKNFDFDKPTSKISVSFTENGDQTLLIGAKTSGEEDTDYYAKNEASETVFTLSKVTVEDFPSKIEGLLLEK